MNALERPMTARYKELKAKYYGLFYSFDRLDSTTKLYYEAAMAEVDDALAMGQITTDEQEKLYKLVASFL